MYSTYIMGMGILDFDSSLEEVLVLMSFQPQTFVIIMDPKNLSVINPQIAP